MSSPVKEWKTIRLGDLGFAYGGLTGKSSKDFGSGKPYITYRQVFNNTSSDPLSFEKVLIGEDEQNIVEYGDILFTTSSETFHEVGMSSVYLNREVKPYLNSFCFGFRPNSFDYLLPEFANYYLRGDDFRRKVFPLAQGSTRFNLSKKYFLTLEITLPSLSEQNKIVSILKSVDDVIELLSSKLIKLKDLKKATMVSLLTRGLGHKVYKKGISGEIPSSWDIKRLDDVAKRGSGHTPNKQFPEYWNGGIKWVSLADSSKLDNRTINETDKNISALGIENSSAVLHPKGTVILSRDAGVGKSAILADQMAVSQHFMAWVCGGSLNNYYLYFYLQFMKPIFESVAIGNTIKTIGLPYFKALKIPVPPIAEQIKIVEILNSQEDNIALLGVKLNKLQNLKFALMQDLLTGKVRVPVN